VSKSDTFENGLLRHVLLNEAIALVGDATGLPASATAGSLYVALHSADPGEGGSQTTNEVGYTGYSRVAVARNGSGWSVTGNTGSNVAVVTFGACAAGSVTATHFSVGCSASGAGKVLYRGALSPSVSITSSPSTQPVFAAGALTITEE